MSTGAILSVDALHARVQKRALLGVLVGSLLDVRALRVARELERAFPALLPEFAASLVDSDARTACWELAEIARDLAGAFDLYHEARAVAADAPTPWFVRGRLGVCP